jgi:hypothetical protein
MAARPPRRPPPPTPDRAASPPAATSASPLPSPSPSAASPDGPPPAAWKVVAGLVALHLVALWMTWDPTPFNGGDNAAYVALARSVLEGRYVELWTPGAPAHTQYPPVFPLILAIAMKLGASVWTGVKLVMAPFSAAGVAATYLWARRTATHGVALGTGLTMAVAPGMLVLVPYVLSDIPFWTFTMVALLVITRLERRATAADVRGGRASGDAAAVTDRERTWAAVGGALTALAYLTRSAGLPLLIAAPLWLAVRRRFGALAAFLATALPGVLAWHVYTASLGKSDYASAFRYVNPYDPAQGTVGLADVAARMAPNLGKYVSVHLPVLLQGRATMGLALGLAVVALALVGWGRRMRRPGVAELWLPMYVGLLVLWPPVWSGERLLLPAFALILLYAGESLRDLATRVTGNHEYGAVAAAALLGLAVAGVWRDGRAARDCADARRVSKDLYACKPAHWREFFRTAEMARGKLPRGSVVLSRKPQIFYVTSGYPSVLYPLSKSADSLRATARRAGANYVFLDATGDLAPHYLFPALTEMRDDVCVVAALQLKESAVLRFDPDGPPLPADAGKDAFRLCTGPEPPPPPRAAR